MILLQMVIQVAISVVFYLIPENIAYGSWVGVVSIRGEAVWYHAGARPGGTEESLSRGQVACVAEGHVHQIPISINRTIEILPPTVNPHIGFVHVPTGSHRSVTPLT
jgi:hypothetical protein